MRKCFEFTGEEPFFRGHFPGMPILPGVMQLELAHRAVEELAGHPLILRAAKKVKFVHVIEPHHSIELTVEGDPTAGDVVYRFTEGEVLCSSGVLAY